MCHTWLAELITFALFGDNDLAVAIVIGGKGTVKFCFTSMVGARETFKVTLYLFAIKAYKSCFKKKFVDRLNGGSACVMLRKESASNLRPRSHVRIGRHDLPINSDHKRIS